MAMRREAALAGLLAVHAVPPALALERAVSKVSADIGDALVKSTSTDGSLSTAEEAAAGAAATAPGVEGSMEGSAPAEAAAFRLGDICSI